MKIFEVQAKGQHTGGICYHVTGVIGTKFYCLLGQKPSFTTKINSVHIFDMVNKVWTEIENPSGKAPTLRALSSSCVVGSKIYVFGGYSQATPQSNHTVYNGMYVFDTETLSWAHIETNGICPDPRAGAQMWHYKGSIYLYGGCQGKQVYFSGLYSYDIENNQWKVVETKGNIGLKYNPLVEKSNQNNTNNQCPQRLCCFSISVIENLVYVFGGLTADEENENQSATNALYVLDMETFEWSRPILSKDNSMVPSARASHCITTVNTSLIMTGGSNILSNNDFDHHIYLFNILERKWYRLTDLFFGSHLPKLVGMSAIYCEQTKEVFFLGGKDVDDTLKFHFYYINCKSIKELGSYEVSAEEIKQVHRKSIRDIEDLKITESPVLDQRNYRDKRSISAADAIFSPLKHSELVDDEDYDDSFDDSLKKRNRRKTIDSLTRFFKPNR